ncbi:unnamed protein product, partial [Hymenolepis diminuta]
MLSLLLEGAMRHLQHAPTLHILRAFEEELKFKNRELAYRQSQTSRLQMKRSLMSSLEIANGDANLRCFSQFRGMRFRRECLNI